MIPQTNVINIALNGFAVVWITVGDYEWPDDMKLPSMFGGKSAEKNRNFRGAT